MNSLLLIHAATTFALIGLIWTIQLVHYPLFAEVGRENFPKYHARHCRRITPLVAPLMLAEAITAGLLVVWGARNPWLLGSFLFIALSWLSTWRWQIPLHARLAKGFDSAAQHRLVATNWLRTAAWTGRGIILICIMA